MKKEVLTEDKLAINQYDYNPTKLPKTKIQHRKNVFVYVIETNPDEENGLLYGVGYYPLSKISISMVHTELTPDETEKKKRKEVFTGKGEDCSGKMKNHIKKKWKGDPKIHNKRMISIHDIKLIAQNAVRFDN